MNQIVDLSPYSLHRIADNVRFLPSHVKSKSQYKNISSLQNYDCCADADFVPAYGRFWNDVEVMGISTFSFMSQNIQRAAHSLFKRNNERLDCFVLPETREIYGAGFCWDCDISASGSVVAKHVAITPTVEFIRSNFELIGLCQFPLREWQVCDFCCAGNGMDLDYDPPEAPDDDLMNLGNELMEMFALDTCQSGNLRRLARILQFTTHHLRWNQDVQKDSLLCKVLELSLTRCVDLKFPNISRVSTIGDIRSMLDNVRFWLSPKEDFEEVEEIVLTTREQVSLQEENVLR